MQADAEEWASIIGQYRDADILDKEMLLKLIDRIEVGEGHMVDGEKVRDIRIHYKFVGISANGQCPCRLSARELPVKGNA